MIQSPPIRRALGLSVLLHGAVGLAAWWAIDPQHRAEVELIDIEVAPPAPRAEALPAEQRRREEALAQQQQAQEAEERGVAMHDAGVDAPIDAPPDAPRRKPDAAVDAAIDAGEPLVAEASDAGIDGEPAAIDDAGIAVAIVPGAGSGSGSGEGSGSGGEGSGSGVDPEVEGAPTTAGTAANLLTYFPAGHTTTALIRFDRLRGTEWAAQTERLLRPMPDYRILFGAADAKIADKLETLVISTPRPQDAASTTLVGRTPLARGPLRAFLGAASPVTWSAAKGGGLGKRTGTLYRGDVRVFLSPFRGWFLLAQPGDLGGLAAPATGNLDAIEATGALPAWLAKIRTIEAESGLDKRGPALVLTLALDGKRVVLGDNDFGLGVKTFPKPDRVSLAAELVKQGWLARGNMRFATDELAEEFVTAAEAVRQRIGDSRILQAAIGKPAARVIANLSFARAGPRVSYATSIAIADMRAILAVAAQQLDAYFAGRP
jgi:hypothetical protein